METDAARTPPHSEFWTTAEVLRQGEAVEQKIARLQCRVFGLPTVRFEIDEVRKVFVPYRYYAYNFEIDRGRLGKRLKHLEREGTLSLVFDCNEKHPFEFDPEGGGDILLEQRRAEGCGGVFLPEQCGREEAEEAVILCAQRKILQRIYMSSGILTLLRSRFFYRPAWQIAIRYKGGGARNLRYAYADAYSVENEHILGLKVRLDNSL
jgi:hypothetical protein